LKKLEEIFESIKKILDEKNELREKIITKSRSTIQLCGKYIKDIHRGKFQDMNQKIQDIKEKIFEIIQNIDKNNLDLFYKGNLFVLFQEFTELCIFYSIVANDEIPSYKDLGVPIDAYLIGLCDVIGELRRFCLDSIRKDDIKNSERCLNYMNMLYESLVSLNYPNGLIPTLRHKIDVARVIVERTRGDVTIAWVMFKSRKN